MPGVALLYYPSRLYANGSPTGFNSDTFSAPFIRYAFTCFLLQGCGCVTCKMRRALRTRTFTASEPDQ